MPSKPLTFGRRAAVPDPPTARPGPAASRPGLSTAAAALLPEIAPAAQTAATGPRIVPRSLRATLLAGLVVGLVQAGISTQHAAAPVLLSAALGGAGAPGAALPIALANGLLSGMLDAFGAIALVRWLLNACGRTGPTAYAIGGAALALSYAVGTQLLGLGSLEPSLPLDVAISSAASVLYRLFAGTKPLPVA